MIVESALLNLIDLFYAVVPQPTPALKDIRHCRVVSHRGEHDNRTVFENTLAAFDKANQPGVSAIEFDVRSTKDGYPVVIHDPDCQRVFGQALDIASTTLADLQQQIPQIPTLQQVIERYSGQLHFMIEIKQTPLNHCDKFIERFEQALARLDSAKDYHLMALDLQLFSEFEFVPAKARLPVAELNVNAMSEEILSVGMAGISGHYLLLHQALRRKHKAKDQIIGTGFITSRKALYREMNRQIDWVFSNHAVKLGAIKTELLRCYSFRGKASIGE